jgi:hypothetical protein
LESILIGYSLDSIIGDGCYTWNEALFDGALGALLGPLGQYGKAADAYSKGGIGKMLKDFAFDESGGISSALRAALHAAGKAAGIADDAHHIVASGAGRAADVRSILQQYGIGINSAANGTFVSRAAHQRMHTNAYYDGVNAALRNESANGATRDEVIQILQRLGGGL